MEEVCYEISGPNLKQIRESLLGDARVVSAEPSGATLHVFAAKGVNVEDAAPGRVRVIEPSLEDVFIALIRKAEKS